MVTAAGRVAMGQSEEEVKCLASTHGTVRTGTEAPTRGKIIRWGTNPEYSNLRFSRPGRLLAEMKSRTP